MKRNIMKIQTLTVNVIIYFQMIPLRNGCAEFMMQHVTMSNCIGIYFFAKAHHCEPLASKANEIIHRNFQVLLLFAR